MKNKDLQRAAQRIPCTDETRRSIRGKLDAGLEREAAKTEGRHYWVRRPAAAVICIALACVLVLGAAAVGGVALLRSVYGDDEAALGRYADIVSNEVAGSDYTLRLEETIADEYTIGYLFSVTATSEPAKLLLATERSTQAFYSRVAESTPTLSSAWETQDSLRPFGRLNQPTVSVSSKGGTYYSYGPPQWYEQYTIHDLTSEMLAHPVYGVSTVGHSTLATLSVVLPDYEATQTCTATMMLKPLTSLGTETTNYYILYLLADASGAMPKADLYCAGQSLTLPQPTKRAGGVQISTDGLYAQYLRKTIGVWNSVKEVSSLDTLTVTPLGLWIEGGRNLSKNTLAGLKLVFADGSEKLLSDMAIDDDYTTANTFDESWTTRTVFLFDAIIDPTQVKALLIYDDLEIPVDGGQAFIRSTGEAYVFEYTETDWLYELADALAAVVPESTYLPAANPSLEPRTCKAWASYSEYGATINSGVGEKFDLLLWKKQEGETLRAAAERCLAEQAAAWSWGDFSITSLTESSYGGVAYCLVTTQERILDSELQTGTFVIAEIDGHLVCGQHSVQPSYYSYSRILSSPTPIMDLLTAAE